MCIAKELSKQFILIIEQIKNEYKTKLKELSKLDLEEQDILHLVEFYGNFNVSQGYKYSKMLSIIRNQRREVKNELNTLSIMYNHVRNGLENKITKIQDKINVQHEKDKNAEYNPRVLKETYSYVANSHNKTKKSDINKLNEVNYTNFKIHADPHMDRMTELYKVINI